MRLYYRLDVFGNMLEKLAFLASKLVNGPLLEHGPVIEAYDPVNMPAKRKIGKTMGINAKTMPNLSIEVQPAAEHVQESTENSIMPQGY